MGLESYRICCFLFSHSTHSHLLLRGMSDESQPPPPSLRLRPRLSASENEANSEAGAPRGEDASTTQKTKIRLRPRLNADAPVDAPRTVDSPGSPSNDLILPPSISGSGPSDRSATAPAADALAPVSPIRLKPRSSTQTELAEKASIAAHEASPVALAASPILPAPRAAPLPKVADAVIPPASTKEPAASEVNPLRINVTPEGVKLKLRPVDVVITDPGLLVGALPEHSTPSEGSSTAPVAPPLAPVIKRTPPPFPVLDTAPKRPPSPRIPHLAAKESPSMRPEKPVRKSQGTPFLVVLLGLAVAGGGAYFGWSYFKKAPSVATPATTVAPRAVTPSETLNALASVPAQAIQKAQDVLASRQEKVGSVVDDIVAEKGSIAPTPPRSSAPVPVSPSTMAGTTATTTVAPGLSASMPIAAAEDASAAFREFVANAKISGVAETRALINGRLVRTGEIVDPALGIRFHTVDRETKQLIFRDFSGAQVGRRY
jgi:hypothetical protein